MNYRRTAGRLANQGRFGDSTLVHMKPAEVAALERLSPFGLTRNPKTGLKEAWILPLLGGLAGNFLGPTLGVGAGLGAAIGTGAGSYAETGEPLDAVINGLLSYGMSNVVGSMGDIGTQQQALANVKPTAVPPRNITMGPTAPSAIMQNGFQIPAVKPTINAQPAITRSIPPAGDIRRAINTQNVAATNSALANAQNVGGLERLGNAWNAMGSADNWDKVMFGKDYWTRTSLPIGAGLGLGMMYGTKDGGSAGKGKSGGSNESDRAMGSREYYPISEDDARRYGLIPEHLFFSPFSVTRGSLGNRGGFVRRGALERLR